MIDWTSDNDVQDRKDLVGLLAYFGCGIAVIIFIVGSLSKKVLCRCIPCANLSLPPIVTQVGTLIAQVIAVMLATVIVLNQT